MSVYLFFDKVFKECYEYTLMHAEKLIYMIQNLDDRYKKTLPLQKINFDFNKVIFYIYIKHKTKKKSLIINKKCIKIPAGIAKMGADFHKQDWGWDNEFPSYGKVLLPLLF